MTKRRLVSVIAVVVASAVSYMLWPRSECRVPAICDVEGRTLTIRSVKRLPDGGVRVRMTARPKGRRERLAKFGAAAVSGADDVQGRWVRSLPDGGAELELVFRPPDDAESFSLDQQLRFGPNATPVRFDFRVKKGCAFPIQARSAGFKASLLAVHVNKRVESNRHKTSSGFRWICRMDRDGAVKAGKRFLGVEMDLPYPGRAWSWDCTLTEDSGHVLKDPNWFIDRFVWEQQTASGHAAGPVNTTEQAVALVSPVTARRMHSNRLTKAYQDAQRLVKHSVDLFAFPETKPPPEDFKLTIKGSIGPADDSGVAADFSFNNVPIPRR